MARQQSRRRSQRRARLTISTCWEQARESTSETLFSPAMHGLPVGGASALAILPIHDANGRLLEALSDDALAPGRICAGILAVDPLRRWMHMFDRLHACGIANICTWPSVGIFGPDMQRDLSPHGLGFDAEAAFVQAAAANGFKVSATIFDSVQAARMAAAGASRVILHPPLPPAGEAWLGPEMIAWLTVQAELIARLGVELLVYLETDDPGLTEGLDFDIVSYGPVQGLSGFTGMR